VQVYIGTCTGSTSIQLLLATQHKLENWADVVFPAVTYKNASAPRHDLLKLIRRISLTLNLMVINDAIGLCVTASVV
jgi:hypothetical protein